MVQELVPPTTAHVCPEHKHCEDLADNTDCPAHKDGHVHCSEMDCELEPEYPDEWSDAVDLLVRFARATRGWTGDLVDDARRFLRENAPEEVWP